MSTNGNLRQAQEPKNLPARTQVDGQLCVFNALEVGSFLMTQHVPGNTVMSTGRLICSARRNAVYLFVQALNAFIEQERKGKETEETQAQNIEHTGKSQTTDESQNIDLVRGLALPFPQVGSLFVVVGLLQDPSLNLHHPLDQPIEFAIPALDGVREALRFWVIHKEDIQGAVIDYDVETLLKHSSLKPRNAAFVRIQKTKKVDLKFLRERDFTHGLKKLLDPNDPWSSWYAPRLQVYHPKLDASIRAQSGIGNNDKINFPPDHANAFIPEGATRSNWLFLPSPMELLAQLFAAANSPAYSELLGEPALAPTNAVPAETTGNNRQSLGNKASGFRLSTKAKEDIHESIERLSFFLQKTPIRENEIWERVRPFQVLHGLKPQEGQEVYDILDEVYDNIAYGIQASAQDPTSPDYSPLKPGVFLTVHEACGLPPALLQWCRDDMDLFLQHMEDFDSSQYDVEKEKLRKVADQLTQKHCQGHLAWTLLRLSLESKLLKNMAKHAVENGEYPNEITIPTQRLDDDFKWESAAGLTLEIQIKDDMVKVPHTWMTPFLYAPPSWICRVSSVTREYSSRPFNRFETELCAFIHHSLQSKFILANRITEDNHQGASPFEAQKAFCPLALYDTQEDAQKAMDAIVEMSGEETPSVCVFQVETATAETSALFLHSSASALRFMSNGKTFNL